MAKTLVVGDPVLFLGRRLVVTALAGGLATCRDEREEIVRTEARAQVEELRAKQESASADAFAALATEIASTSAAASAAIFHLRLRADLLVWWEDQATWVSDGRILSDAQHEQVTGKRGVRVKTEQQRAAFTALTKGG